MPTRIEPLPGSTAKQTARTSAALAAAGAYDTSPTVLACAGFDWVTLFITYTRGGTGGDVQFKAEASPANTGDSWYQMGRYAGGTISSGADVLGNVQREEIEYGSTGAGAEKFTVPPINIRGCERLRVSAQESGATGTPGTCEIIAYFS